LVCSTVAVMSEGTIRGSGQPAELARSFQSQQVVINTCQPTGADNGQPVEQIRQHLAGVQHPGLDLHIAATGNQTQQIRFAESDQRIIDQIVDTLRANTVSITRLEIQQPTLEDIFMKLVHREGPPASDGSPQHDRSSGQAG
ncbi:MAG: DUF4162 domain-containing protein, partial [Pirellulales bacterium]|nr:DUF4162 domain-containing protein [Pirellulales bacterium]